MMTFGTLLKRSARSGKVRARAGFTMIELLLVMAILGTLVATFAISTASARENAKVVKATAESRSLANSIRLFCMAMTDTAVAEEARVLNRHKGMLQIARHVAD